MYIQALAAFQATLESQGKAELEGGFVIEKSMYVERPSSQLTIFKRDL